VALVALEGHPRRIYLYSKTGGEEYSWTMRDHLTGKRVRSGDRTLTASQVEELIDHAEHTQRDTGDTDRAFSQPLRRIGECGPMCPAGGRGPKHNRGDVLGPAGRPAAVLPSAGSRARPIRADRRSNRSSGPFPDAGDNHPWRISLLLSHVCRAGVGVDERGGCPHRRGDSIRRSGEWVFRIGRRA